MKYLVYYVATLLALAVTTNAFAQTPIDSMTVSMPSSVSVTDPMSREGSGTSWLPDTTPTYAKMWMQSNGNAYMLHGTIMPRYTDVGSTRGDRRVDAPNWFMGMFTHPLTANSELGIHLMMSLDPITEGGYGYPLLYQTGETWHGVPLHDRQHPHNLFDEISTTYSKDIGSNRSAYLYLAYPGEPALGPPTYMHRLIAMDLADAPIGHHWQDATHITFGVATLGLELSHNLKIEASSFTGREPGENRYDFEKPLMDSASTRLSWNPDSRDSIAISYGYIKNPEGDGVGQHRQTASWIYDNPLTGDSNLTTTLSWGQNNEGVSGGVSNSYLEELDYQHGRDTVFSRMEQIQKSGIDLFLPSPYYTSMKYWLGEYTIGYIRDLSHGKGVDTGVGADISLGPHPSSLDPFYGSSLPVSFEVFLRLRASRSKMDTGDHSSMAAMPEVNIPMPMASPAPTPTGSEPPVTSPVPISAPQPTASPTPTPAPSATPLVASGPTITTTFSPTPVIAGQTEHLQMILSNFVQLSSTTTLTADVAMTTMDMGTSHPAFKMTAPGKYATNVQFAMQGIWKVTVHVRMPGQATVTKVILVKVGN